MRLVPPLLCCPRQPQKGNHAMSVDFFSNCVKWKTIMKELGTECIYTCPDRKESAARAERAVGILKIVVK